ncbi:hypothetical protein [Magnetofaba australis]|nr:hypothetical protein [Magnetofaba australis]
MDAFEFHNKVQAVMDAIESLPIGQALAWEIEPAELGSAHLELSRIKRRLENEIRLTNPSLEGRQ